MPNNIGIKLLAAALGIMGLAVLANVFFPFLPRWASTTMLFVVLLSALGVRLLERRSASANRPS